MAKAATTAIKTGTPLRRAAASDHQWGGGRSIPTILQLLVFAETVPTVNELLDDARTHQAAYLGSSLPAARGAWACRARFGHARRPFALLGSDPTRICAILLAASAVATTALGSILALKSDVAPAASRPRCAACTRRCRLWPSLTSGRPSKAMDFAGAYPVAILWGVFPPLACLKLRRTTPGARTAGPDAWLVVLAAVSGLFVASTAARDIRGVFRLLF